MTLADNLLGNAAERYVVVALSLLALFTTLAAVAWRCIRCATACRPHAVEQRTWTYCPKCGWSRPADATGPSPDPATAPIRDAITLAGTSTTEIRLLPSALLRK